MDKFPENFNFTECKTKMCQFQNNLLKDTRKNIYETVINNISECSNKVNIKFPKNLWFSHRRTIAEELLKRFGEITIITLQGQTRVTRITDNIADVQNIEEMIIEFCEN